MAKIILEMDYYEDKAEIDMILKVNESFACLRHVDNLCRSRLKHGDPCHDEEVILEDIRSKIAELGVW